MPEQEYLIVDHLTRHELARIFSKIRVNKETGCWEWIAASASGGYGCVYYRGKLRRAHRLIYAWLVGPIPKGQRDGSSVLDHFVCDNPPCCNPAHLKLGPQRDNVLRGKSLMADNARKTHCSRGHLLPAEPNRVNGSRRCKKCWYIDFRNSAQCRKNKKEYLRLYRQRKREEKALNQLPT